MRIYITKLKHILPPFITISLSTIIGLLTIRWVFTIEFEIIDIKEKIWNFWLPVLLPWIPILIWLRPRFKILILKNDHLQFFFQSLSAITITACLINSQEYLTTATGTLQKLSTVTDIEKKRKSRYYKLTNFSVATNYGGSYTAFSRSGRSNDLNFDIYFVVPIFDRKPTNINGLPRYWYGVNFHERTRGSRSDYGNEKLYREFYNYCLDRMKEYDFYSLDHFKRTPTSDEKQNFIKAIEARTNKNSENYVILEPIKENYEKRNGNKFQWIFGSFGIGFSILLFTLIWPKYSAAEMRNFKNSKKPQ
ncbi:hypothetical protein [Flavobacterium sp. ACN6]|uniref:hypothetical protein n=1 Tax=Flavobacterium sp. ACN6 TaxID=1920426 RepID=UPI000BB3BC0B|nr:hypothetical protein [Flavobacterium sp. ACN6]PBJ09040.1 hypothetical protein BSF42_35220 [Flavobacterium sp. ACN6]